MLLQSFYRALIELTNGRITSGALKRFAQSKASRFLIPSYVKLYKLNLDEVERGINEFPTLHDLFVRKLKEKARNIHPDSSSVVSPVDGVLEDIGEIRPDKRITVKGKEYSIEEMLNNGAVLEKYIGGSYMVMYLSPSHYHRIHSPVSGEVTERWLLGKKSYPVNAWGMKFGRDPLSKNYRLITELKHEGGHISLVKVGAMFVNSIVVTHSEKRVGKGEELAYFSFGSTVVLLFEKGTFTPAVGNSFPLNVHVGEEIGYIKNEVKLPVR
ncbi:phosphatidylserine decarboxylase [Peribacillus deserti]|uniref:phosphatidylserine decarboxylase n=1 Tax=Peribacillus deserti TaxID=673318 RepID=A0ABS2QG99_9BACI|nr:phosphatidylserine decarboxylase [Peribacillus deserti]MBM7691844.1 phosphatidylserine decarboxylase [Peribacillus deserti]